MFNFIKEKTTATPPPTPPPGELTSARAAQQPVLNGTAVTDPTSRQSLQPPPAADTPISSSRAESFHSAAESASELGLQETPASSARASQREEEEELRLPTSSEPALKTVIPRPPPRSKIPAPPKLTSEQETKYATVLATVSTWESLPASTAKKAPSEPLADHERMWLTRECLLRYLRATKWNTANALTRLQSTLVWRREYGADKFTFDYISPENETGKQVILGYDMHARPCLYLQPGKQNTDMSDRQIHHLCFMLDQTVAMMPPGQENACLIINFKGAGAGKMPTSGQARAVLNILQGHNPERLGRALISELPWYVNAFFKVISPFIDPVTRDKMKFNEDLRAFVPAENLWRAHEGDLNFEYEHPTYWRSLEREVGRRKAAYVERWVAGGKRMGEYEEYLRGGERASLAQEERKGKEKEVEKEAEAERLARKVEEVKLS